MRKRKIEFLLQNSHCLTNADYVEFMFFIELKATQAVKSYLI